VLAERALVRVLGKKEEVGRPLLYGTTKEFLDFFSLSDLRELPTLREYSELTPESRQVVEDSDRASDLEPDQASDIEPDQASDLGRRASGEPEPSDEHMDSGGPRPEARGPEIE